MYVSLDWIKRHLTMFLLDINAKEFRNGLNEYVGLTNAYTVYSHIPALAQTFTEYWGSLSEYQYSRYLDTW